MTKPHHFAEAPSEDSDDYDPDAPPLTDEEIAAARPFAEAFPELAASIRRRGAQKAPVKVRTTIRLSSDVIEHFRAQGAGWQSRIDRVLRDWIADRAA